MDNLSQSGPASTGTSSAAPAKTSTSQTGSRFWHPTQLLAAAIVCTVGVAAAIYSLRPVGVNGQPGAPGQTGAPGQPAAAPANQPRPAQQLFVGWGNPDLAILVSGQEHGYWQRCGCTDPQLGGLTRRYNFMQHLKGKGWPLVAVDIGEVAQNHGPQAMLKYEYQMKLRRIMDYAAVAIGLTEFNMPLAEAIGRYSLNNPSPTVIATNLQNLPAFKEMNLDPYRVVDVTHKIVDARQQLVDARLQLGFFSSSTPRSKERSPTRPSSSARPPRAWPTP